MGNVDNIMYDLLMNVFYLFYLPESLKTCERGYHTWGKWDDGIFTQTRNCLKCNKIEIYKEN